MILKLAFLLIQTFCLKQIQPIQDEFILVNDETISLILDDFFVGDSIQYQINSSPCMNLTNSFSTINQQSIPAAFNTTPPPEISQFIIIPENISALAYLVYSSSETLTFLELNLYDTSLAFKYQVEVGEIQQIKLIEQVYSSIILILTKDQELSYIKIQGVDNIGQIKKAEKIEIDLKGSTNLLIGEGFIEDILIITGYEEDSGFVAVCRVGTVENFGLIQKFNIFTDLKSKFLKIFSLVNGNEFYVVSPFDPQLIKFNLKGNEYVIDNVLKLQVLENITSIGLSSSTNSILIGIKNGFIKISQDFQQIYIKKEVSFSETVYVFPGRSEDMILTGKNTLFTLYNLGSYNNLLGNSSFMIQQPTFMWTIIEVWPDYYYFLYGMTNYLYIEKIKFNNAKLSFASEETSHNYTLIVIQTNPPDKIEKIINVRRPTNNTAGYTELISTSQVLVEFENFKSSIMIPLHNYLIGSNLTVFYSNITMLPSEKNFFNFSLDVIQNIEEKFKFGYNDVGMKKMAVSLEFVFLYNESSFIVYKEGNKVFNYNSDEIIIYDFQNCGFGFLIYFWSNNSTSYSLMYFPSYKSEDSFTVNLKGECIVVLCSLFYVVCQETDHTFVYHINFLNDSQSRSISNTYFNNNINSMSLGPLNLLSVIYNDNSIVLIDIEIIFTNNSFFPIMKAETPYNTTKIYTSFFNIYIEDTYNNIYMYQLSYTPLRTFQVYPSSNIKIVNHFLVSESSGELLIIDTLQSITNSTIAQLSLPKPLDFAIFYSSSQLNIYLLYPDQVVQYSVPEYYNNLNISAQIINFSDLDQIEYEANVELSVGNNFSNQCFIIPLVLYVNGETIFKNSTEIKILQNEKLDCTCGDNFEINMDDLFLGQGLDGNVSGSKYVTLERRFQIDSKNYFEMNFSVVEFSKIRQEYLVNKDCYILLLNSQLIQIYNVTIADERENTCECYDIYIVQEKEYLGFVVSCTIKKIILEGELYIDYFENILYFGVAQDDGYIYMDLTIAVDHPIGLIQGLTKESGEYLLVGSEKYGPISKSSYYSSHLVIITGNMTSEYISANKLDCDYSNLFNLNFYYLTDTQIIFDPMFDNYYVYTLDFYFGVRIFTINSFICSAGPEIQFDSNHVGSSLAICGKYLYIAMQDTDIRIFSVSNWVSPYYIYTITTYTRVFKTIQGSLRCSSISFAQYLLFQTNSSDGIIWLHIVDTQSNLMANTVANYPIGTNNQNIHSFSADFQNNTGNLLLIDSNSSTIFKINQFKLVFNINNKYCDESSKENITVSVKNTNNKTSEARFKLKVTQYTQGSVNSSTIHLWELALICIGTLALSLFLFVLIRKKLLKNRRKVQTKVLFNYSNDFVDTFPNVNNSFN